MPAVPFRSYPTTDEGSWSWTAAAQDAILGLSGDEDWERYKSAHAWYSGSGTPEIKGAYKLPHHLAAGGELVTHRRGVIAAMAALMGSRGGVDIPEGNRRAVHSHLSKHYAEFELDPPEFAASMDAQAFIRHHIDQMSTSDELREIVRAIVPMLAFAIPTPSGRPIGQMLKPPIDGAEITWLDATREGDFAGYIDEQGEQRQAIITEQHIDEMVTNLQRAETPPPIDGGNVSMVHETVVNSAAEAAGFVLGGAKAFDGKGRAHLWVCAAIRPDVAPQIARGGLLYGSVVFKPSNLHPESGQDVGAVLHSYALTNKPFVPGTEPHRLGRTGPEPMMMAASIRIGSALEQPIAEGKKMAEQQERNPAIAILAAMLGAEADAMTDEQIAEAIKGKLSAAPATTTDVQAAETAARLIALEAANKDLLGFKEQYEQRVREDEVRTFIASEAKTRRLQFSDQQVTELVKIGAAHGVDVLKTSFANIAAATPRGTVLAGTSSARTVAAEGWQTAMQAAEKDLPTDTSMSPHERMRMSLRIASKKQPELFMATEPLKE